MAKNPTGPDGLPMEKHHPGRLNGNTELTSKTAHDSIHQGEIKAVRDIMKKDSLKGNPNTWTGKSKK